MRDYQKECIETIVDFFQTNNRQLIQLPTGAGKTWIFCEYLANNSKSFLITCPSIELKEQIIKTAKRFGIRNIGTSLSQNFDNYIITTSALAKSMELIYDKKLDHIVIDEAHHAQSKTYNRLIDNINPSIKVIGFTATPERLDGKCLLDIFGKITYEKTIIDMVRDGYLSDIQAYRIKTNQKISIRGNDFRPIELKNLDNESRNSIIENTFINHCKDKKTLIFCLNVDHSIKMAHCLQKRGISAAYVHGKMSKSLRKSTLEKFKTGEIQVVTNCQILTEGFDEPSIEALIIARPTSSKSLYCQMIGRGLRKTETKNLCYLYELTDNNHKLCTFNVAAGKEPEFQREYKPGTKLTELYKELESIPYEKIETQIQQINLFDRSILTSSLTKYDMTQFQKFMLDLYDISYYDSINFLEAAFLIWKWELKEKYGDNKRKKRIV